MRAPLAPPLLSEPRKVDADAQAVETSSETDKPDAKILRFRRLYPGTNQFMVDSGNGVLPVSSSAGTSGPR